MPFTISHAAAVLPLHKWSNARLPLSALMIGSMSPDFWYFIPFDLTRISTHNFVGLFWFCWPVSLLLWILFVRVLEQPTFALLPEPWRVRLIPCGGKLDRNTLMSASVAAILGAATHVIWDSFTHGNSPTARALPVLWHVVLEFADERVRLYSLLQHASSVLGMAVLIVWAWRVRHRPVQAQPPITEGSIAPVSHRARIAAVLVLIATASVFAVTSYLRHLGYDFESRLFFFAISGMTGAALAWCAIAIAIRSRAIQTGV
jgi:Domain of unknown function (DUF4184)